MPILLYIILSLYQALESRQSLIINNFKVDKKFRFAFARIQINTETI